MRYRVEGTEVATGAVSMIAVNASSEVEAREKAARLGIRPSAVVALPQTDDVRPATNHERKTEVGGGLWLALLLSILTLFGIVNQLVHSRGARAPEIPVTE